MTRVDFLNIKPVLLLLFMSIAISTKVSAAPVTSQFNGLKLNAELIQETDKTKPFFLILHGTFAWHGMELPATIQALLKEENFGSLAITLSLAENNRSGFFDCQHTIRSKHQNAVPELAHWMKFLRDKGYHKIVLVGHSRGGAQVAAFAKWLLLKGSALASHELSQIYLIAPMTWNADKVKSSFNRNAKLFLSELLSTAVKKPELVIKNQNILHCKNANITGASLLSYYSNHPNKNTPSLLVNIPIATRIYLGDQDTSITSTYISKRAILESNPLITMRIIEDADHYFRDFAADDLVTDMIENLVPNENSIHKSK
jgi:pimeloyl-ACP methyl ester carboxylesterase